MWMSADSQFTKWRRKIAENFNRPSSVHGRYRRQTNDRQTDGRQHIAKVITSANETISWLMGHCRCKGSKCCPVTRRPPRRQQNVDLSRPFRVESGLQGPARRPPRGRQSRLSCRTRMTERGDHEQGTQHQQLLYLHRLRTVVHLLATLPRPAILSAGLLVKWWSNFH